MTRQEAARLGGLATFRKYGREHYVRIGREGWQACLIAVAERQNIPVDYRGNPFRNLLANLKAAKASQR